MPLHVLLMQLGVARAGALGDTPDTHDGPVPKTADTHDAAARGVAEADVERLTLATTRLRDMEREHGVRLLGDHDPGVAPGFFVARHTPPSADLLARLLRSWESFDRAFEACGEREEAELMDTRVLPFLAALGPLELGARLAQEHAFVVDGHYVGSFPDERFRAHAARREAWACVPDLDLAGRGLERVLRRR